MANVIFILGHKRFEKVTKFEEMVQEVMDGNTEYFDIQYGLEFVTKEQGLEFMEKLPKSMQKKLSSYGEKFIVRWKTNISRDGLFANKNVKGRIEKIISLLNSAVEEKTEVVESKEIAKAGDKIKLVSGGTLNGTVAKVKFVSHRLKCYIIVIKGLNYTIPFENAELVK